MFGILLDAEEGGQARDGEGLADGGLTLDEHQLATGLPSTLERADQNPDAHRIQKRHARHVDYHALRIRRDGKERIPQTRSSVEINIAGDSDRHDVTAVFVLDRESHAPTILGRSPCVAS